MKVNGYFLFKVGYKSINYLPKVKYVVAKTPADAKRIAMKAIAVIRPIEFIIYDVTLEKKVDYIDPQLTLEIFSPSEP